MKVIELLNRIINDEEIPEYIRYYNKNEHMQLVMMVCKENIIYRLNENAIGLNDEVEIIEEPQEHKIPGKLDISNFPRHNNSLKKTAIKINKIIDYLEGIK